MLDGLEVPVTDAVAEEEAVLESDTAGDSDVGVDCVDDAVKDAELDDVTVAVSLGVDEPVSDAGVLGAPLVVLLEDKVGDTMGPEEEGEPVADSVSDLGLQDTQANKTTYVRVHEPFFHDKTSDSETQNDFCM